MDLKERKEYLLQLIREFCEDVLGKPYVDSMGCSHILYFPDLITN